MIQYLLVAAIDIAIAYAVLSRERSGAAIALALIGVTAGLWSLELFLLSIVQDLDSLYLWFHLTRLGMFLIPPSLALLVWRLTGSKSEIFKKAIVVPGYIIGLTLFLLNNLLIPTSLREANGAHLPEVDIILYAFIGEFILCLLGSIAFSIIAYKSAVNREKKRLLWLLATMIVSFVSGSASLYFLSYNFYLSKSIGATTNLIFMFMLFYSTIEHNLMDIKLAISAGLSRIMLLAFYCCLYFAITPAIYSNSSGIASAVMISMFFVVVLESYTRLLGYITPKAHKIFSVDTFNMDKVKQEYSEAFSHCENYQLLARKLDHLFHKVMKVQHYQLLVPNTGDLSNEDFVSISNSKVKLKLPHVDSLLAEQIRGNRVLLMDEATQEVKTHIDSPSIEGCVPISLNGKIIALLLIGKSSIASFYRYNDIRLLEWLSTELAQTINRIVMLHQLQNELGEAKKKLSMLEVMNIYNHDIKAPFSVIDGVITHELYDPERRREVILEQVAWGSHLITSMAQILKGDRQRKSEAVNLQETISACCSIFNHAADNIEVNHQGPCSIIGDEGDLKILFINAIKNALEATRPEESIAIKINSRFDSQGVYVEIIDNGTGMPAEKLANIWSGIETTKENGSGIGLQAMKRIANEHDARIEVSSHVGSGSNFTFHFPPTSGV